jgi:hypothetical protein
MNTLEKIKQAFIVMEQPVSFQQLYPISETTTAQGPRKSSHDRLYQQPCNFHKLSQLNCGSVPQGYIRRKRNAIRLALDTAWKETKVFGRAVVRWLAWRVFLPLSVIASIWVPLANPAELPF